MEDINKDIEILENLLEEGFEAMCYPEAQAIEHLIKAYKELEEENQIIKGNYYTLCADIQMVTSELGFPEDTIIADEMVSMIKENYIPVSLVEEKIEEYDKKRIKIEKDDIGVGFTLGKEWSDLKAKKQVLQELLEKRK